jgi:phage terminase large subunit GpA-like protein
MIEQQIEKVLQNYAPPPDLLVSEWADQYRMLSPESSAEPGKWSTDRAPFQRDIMNTFNDPMVEEVTVMGSAQWGKSECINNIVSYCIHQDPSPVMIVHPTIEMGRAWSRDRFTPMVRDTRVLSELIHDDHESIDTVLHKTFPGGNLTVSGSNSGASLAGRPKRVVICDDVDRFALNAGTEGDPISLAFKRTAAFWNRKMYCFSTPTDEKTSRIKKRFLLSDQRYFFVPCHSCGEYQTLSWSDPLSGEYFVRWEKDRKGKEHRPETAHYVCKKCKIKMYDADRIRMVSSGRWVAHEAFKGHAGFFINELYSPWSELSKMVKTFLEVKDNPLLLQVWINVSKGETFQMRGDAPAWHDLYSRRGEYLVGVIPKDALLLVAGADIQGDRVEVEIVAFGRGMQSWSIDYRIFSGNIDKDNVLNELNSLLLEEFPHENGGSMKIKMLAIDSGFSTQTVYNWVRKYPPNKVMAIKGTSNMGTMLGQPKTVDILIDGRKFAHGMKYWPVGVSVIKTELYQFLRQKQNADGTFPDGYCHFPDYDEEYFKQITAEEMRVINRRFEWSLMRTRNEALDTRVYARAAAAALGVDRFTDDVWKRLEKETFPNQAPSMAAPQGPPKKRVISRGIQI